ANVSCTRSALTRLTQTIQHVRTHLRQTVYANIADRIDKMQKSKLRLELIRVQSSPLGIYPMAFRGAGWYVNEQHFGIFSPPCRRPQGLVFVETSPSKAQQPPDFLFPPLPVTARHTFLQTG